MKNMYNRANQVNLMKLQMEKERGHVLKTPIAYEITDYSLMHSTDFMMYDTPYEDGNQDILMSMYMLVGDSETGGSKGRVNGIVAYAVDNNEDDGCVWVAIGNVDNGDSRYYVKIADKTAEYF